ncbi:MAG: type VII toxin-antitoxin system HepT family RNase toxin [Pseudohaliea sp.]
MSGTDRPYEAYVYALREQVAQHLAGLDELSETLAARPLTFNERNASERGLQVMVERAVGCSKHLLKARQLPVPAEARAALERVYEQLALNEPPLAILRGAVGMRNAIIHDYLNLDWRRLEAVLADRKYYEVARYVEVLCARLLNDA